MTHDIAVSIDLTPPTPAKPLMDQNLDFINLNDIQDLPKVDIPNGEYHAKLVNLESKTSKQGNPMLSYQWVIQSGEHAGRSVYGQWVFTESAAWRFKRDAKAMQVAGANGTVAKDAMLGWEGIIKLKSSPRRDPDKNWEPNPELGNQAELDRVIGPLK